MNLRQEKFSQTILIFDAQKTVSASLMIVIINQPEGAVANVKNLFILSVMVFLMVILTRLTQD